MLTADNDNPASKVHDNPLVNEEADQVAVPPDNCRKPEYQRL